MNNIHTTPVITNHRATKPEARQREKLHDLVDQVPAEYLEPATYLLELLASDNPHDPIWWASYYRWVRAEAFRAIANGTAERRPHVHPDVQASNR